MSYFLIDGHNDLPWAHRKAYGYDLDAGDIATAREGLATDLTRLDAGGVKGQFWSVYVPSTLAGPDAVVATLEQIDFVHQMARKYERLKLVTTADQLEEAVTQGAIASLIGMEGGHSIGGSLAVLRQLHSLGARYMTLTHNEATEWADSATDSPRVGGLSAFGRQVVAEMNRLGMMVDLAHVADTTMHDALATSSAPVIFSHSNARTICDVPRNVPDDVLVKMPDNGGLVMVTFVPFFTAPPVARWMADAVAEAQPAVDTEAPVGPFEAMRRKALFEPPPRSTIEDVVAHIEYLREMIGVAHLGIGGDFDGADQVTVGLEDVATYSRLFAALHDRGWSPRDIDALAGRNLLRVMRDVEAVAAE